MGDGWDHEIKVEAIQDGSGEIQCLEGQRSCPPEDCGSPYGYEHRKLVAMLRIAARGEHGPTWPVLIWIVRWSAQPDKLRAVMPKSRAFISGTRWVRSRLRRHLLKPGCWDLTVLISRRFNVTGARSLTRLDKTPSFGMTKRKGHRLCFPPTHSSGLTGIDLDRPCLAMCARQGPALFLPKPRGNFSDEQLRESPANASCQDMASAVSHAANEKRL